LLTEFSLPLVSSSEMALFTLFSGFSSEVIGFSISEEIVESTDLSEN